MWRWQFPHGLLRLFEFLEEYLRPCWRGVVLGGRSRQIPLPEADDLFQELMVQLLRSSGFNHRVRSLLADSVPDLRDSLTRVRADCAEEP